MMRKSLVVLSLCAAFASTIVTHSVLASDSTDQSKQTAEIKPTIAQGDASAVGAASAVCSGCHGADGISTIPENPNLAGQGAPYLYKQLTEFKSGARENVVMSGMVAALDEDTMRNLSAFYDRFTSGVLLLYRCQPVPVVMLRMGLVMTRLNSRALVVSTQTTL